MTMYAGLDVGFKRTVICVVDERGEIVWRGIVDTHPEALSAGLAIMSCVANVSPSHSSS